MKKKNVLVTAVTCTILGASLSVHAAPSWAKKGDTIVKCLGVAKKGANDCGANGHDCANMATKDNDSKEWVYMPEGACEKIVGGVVLTKKTVE